MSGLDRLLSGVKTFVMAADDLKSLKAEVSAIDARERELRLRVTYMEGLLAAVGAPIRLPRD